MLRKTLTIALGRFAVVVMLGAAGRALAQDAKAPYPSMAPLDQYLMERNAEIALARSAAPESISRDAEVMVRAGMVRNCGKARTVSCGRRNDPGPRESTIPIFGIPNCVLRICFNPPAARTYLLNTIKRTELGIGRKLESSEMFEGIKVAFDKKELPALESGAMCYMMSKQSYLGDRDGHWHSHLMFFVPLMDPAEWGAGCGIPCSFGVRGYSGPS